MIDPRDANPPLQQEDRTHASPARWAALASEAKPELDKLDHGRREEGFRSQAEKVGVSPQTLRRAVAMLNFVEKAEQLPLLANLNLRAVPLNGLEHIKKWYEYDPKGAAEAARQLVKGAMVEAIAAAESAARQAVSPTLKGRALAVEYRRSLSQYLDERLFDEGYRQMFERRSLWHAPRVDCRFRKHDQEEASLVAIAMGPYENKNAYMKLLGDTMIRSLGLGTIFERVILATPEKSIALRAKDWIIANRIRDSKIDILHFDSSPSGT